MSQEILIVVDNESDTVIYGGREWTGSEISRWYGGSSTSPTSGGKLDGSSGTVPYGSLDFAFHGIAVAFYGNTPRNEELQNATVSIDGGLPYNSSFSDPGPQTYLQWYQSPRLPEGNHTISLTNLAEVSVDFIVVTAGPSTPLNGQMVIVDDDDPSIHYIGSWSRDRGTFSPDPSTKNPDGYPFHNGTHRSLTEGDALTVNFTGTSINVFGVFDFSALGNLSAIFDLDGRLTPLTYVVGPDTPELKAKVGQRPNFPYFSQTSLAGGNHTLTINITQSNSIPFVLDFLTYNPSFPSAEADPEFSPSVSLFPTSTNLGTPSFAPSPPRRVSLVGLIAGSAIGVLTLIVIAILGCLYVRHRKKNGMACFIGTIPTCLPMRRRKKDVVSRLTSAWSSAHPDPDWHPLRSTEVPRYPPQPTGVTGNQDTWHHSIRPSAEADIWPTFKEQQKIQDQIRNMVVVIAELEHMRAEGGDLARRKSRIARLRARLGSLTSRRAHLNTVAPPPSYRSGPPGSTTATRSPEKHRSRW